MRIVLVSLAGRGGMLHFQVELANALSRIASTAVVMSSAAPTAYLEPAVETAVVRTGRGTLGSLAQAMNPVSLYLLWKGLGAGGADLVHITGVHAWNPLVAALSKLRGKPLLYTVHDPVAHGGAPWSIRISNWMTTRMADSIIVLTRHAEEQLLAAGIPANKIHVIPHGAYSFFRRWEHPRTKAGKVILYFGRFEAYKGLESLLAAFGRVRKAIPGWRLLLAGSGNLPPELLRSMSPNVQVRSGYVPDEDVADLMQRASLVVVPYTTATQSGVIAIAIAFGRPVIATSVGGLSEMVTQGKTGLLVPPDDVRALARAMRTLMTNPNLRRSMGREAARRGREYLGWDRIAAMHLDVYGELISERGDR